MHYLLTIAEKWLSAHYPLRQEAIASSAIEFCLSPESFARGLDWMFAQWTQRNITDHIAQNPFKQSILTAQILAGNTPAMIAQGFYQGAILDNPQYLKIPHNQSRFAQLLHQTFTEYTDNFSITTDLPLFYQQLAKTDLVFAYGHDETLQAIQSHLAPHALFIAHGHAESAAIIFKDATNMNTLEKLADDMLCYDQRGCLSPRVVFIEQGGELSPAECARLFAEMILPYAVKTWPRGGLFTGEDAEILHQCIIARFQGIVYAGPDWTVCYDKHLTWPNINLPRFLPFKPFNTHNELITLFSSLQHPLISLGYSGSPEKIAFLKKIFKNCRFPTIGTMQRQLLVF